MPRISKHISPSGETGLLVAVIIQAVNDLQAGDARIRATALEYIGGPIYREHLELLDVPVEWLPAALEEGNL